MKPNPIILILIFTFSFLNSIHSQPSKVMESFEEGVPQGLSATGRKISIDAMRMKHGAKSLKWKWKGNDQIIFDTQIGYHKQQLLNTEKMDIANGHGGSATNPVPEPPRGFFLWVYNDQASIQRMRIQFGRGDEVDCEFDFNLNFKGWRSIAIAYDRGDMRGVPREDMDRLTINAPATGSGTFYLDMLGTSVTMNPRTVGPNPQLPEIDQHPRLVAQYPHLLMEYSKYRPTFQLEEMTDQVTDDLRKIEQQIELIFWPEWEASSYDSDKLKKIKAQYDKFEIKREGDKIYGRPLLYQHIMNDHFKELGLSKDEKFKGLMRWRQDFNYLLRDVTNMYHYSNDPKVKAEMEQMFLNLFDYGIDQGFDSGAGLGWIHHYSYNIREYGPAMYIMRDVLKKHRKLNKAHEICRWFYSFNQVYNEEYVYNCKGRIAGNADEIQGLLMPRLMTAFLQDDSPEKVRDIRHFSSYFSNVTTGYAQSLDETFKPDGTIFHHAGHAFGYGGRAINGAVSTMYLLSGTSFKASEEAYSRMKKVTETYMYHMFTDVIQPPKTFANIRFGDYQLPTEFYKIPAMLSIASDKKDSEMAAMYADLMKLDRAKTTSNNYWLQKVSERYVDIEKYNKTRCGIFPYTNVGINRKDDDYMITVRAHSKYVYPFESWGKSYFAFPLFIANGYLDVSYSDNIDALTPKKGTWHKGYNWHRWPGTTTVNLPYDKMLTDPGQVRDEGGEYLMSDQPFSGGVSTSYGCGIYAFQFKGHDKFNIQGFTGKKTYFFIDDVVYCMGSDIKSDLDYKVETTLFQTSISKSDATQTEKGTISEFPFENSSAKENVSWYVDQRNTGYYIESIGDAAILQFERATQTNPDFQFKNYVAGDFESLVINHGMQPENASYRYVLMADANAEKMDVLAAGMKARKKDFTVWQQNSEAHVLSIADKKAVAYAVYAEDGADFKKGMVTNVNKQSTIIVKEEDRGLVLSVADPDLNIYDGQDDLLPDGSRCELSIYEREWFYWPSRSTIVKITLKGNWAIDRQIKEMETAKQKNARIISNNKKETIIEFECKDGLSAEVKLKRMK